MHLLVETAVGDSLGYEILSFEELESLKKERTSLNSRMEAVGQKLALESKMRDAAQSINPPVFLKKRAGLAGSFERLHGRSFSRSSQASNGSIPADSLAKNDTEYASSTKKCDELSRELWQLAGRSRQIETQLLRHTAGILQMTHKGPTKRNRNRQSLMNSISQAVRPDSPASSYTYENAGARSPPRLEDKDAFDERSLYRSPDNLDKLVDALRHGKALTPRPDALADGDSGMQNDTLQSVEHRLEDLNDRLRQLIIQANPDTNREYDAAPKHAGDGNAAQRTANIEEKLDYLDQGLRDIEAEQSNIQQQHHESKHSLHAVEGRLEGINNQLYHIIGSSRRDGDQDYPPPPPPAEVSGQGNQEQFMYMEEILYAIEESQRSLISQASERPRVVDDEFDDSARYESVLQGIWSMIVAGEERARQRKLQRRRMLESDPDAVSDLDEMSPDEDPLSEDFTLTRFQIQVEEIYRKASGLKEKQAILRRQIRQQRELNQKSDAEKEEAFDRMRGEIERLRVQLHNSSNSSEALEQEEAARRAAEDRIAELQMELSEAQDDARLATAEAQAQLADAEAKMAQLNDSLSASQASREEAERAVHEKAAHLAQTEQELRELEGEVVRLQTEVTVARAELDGAYGTRAQRAAEVAANPQIKQELDELNARNGELAAEVQRLTDAHASASHGVKEVGERERILREELRDTIAEFEEMTKANVESEREREGLEGVIDGLREKIDVLESQLSDEKVRWLGVKSPGGPNGVVHENTSVQVLRAEFKKMMRETRADGLRALRAEQEERRRLEQILRAVKKEQLPQKSSLSRSMTAS